jgi:fructan beta-fructosidase
LTDWKFESEFGQQWGAHGGVWECPDLIKMQVEGETESKYVLLVSLNPGASNGGSGTQYFIGEFDGHRFKLDKSLHKKLERSPTEGATDRALWLDYGSDNYAGVTWSDIPEADGRHLFIGWMSNWDYAQVVPTERWRSAMTLPRSLKLVRTNRGLKVHSVPVDELNSLRIESVAFDSEKIAGELNLTQFTNFNSGLLEINLQLNSQDARIIELVFGNSDQEATVFRINRDEARYELDRRASGITDFSETFPKIQFAPISGDLKDVSLRAYLDHSSLEIFIDGGETVLTSLHFPKQPYDMVTLRADSEAELNSGSIYNLESIWKR